MSEPWTEDYNVNDLGLFLGHVGPVSAIKRRKKKHPIGFAAPVTPPRKPRGQRKPGTFPDVPRFDTPPTS